MKILVIDVGGTHIKVHCPGHNKPVNIPLWAENDREKNGRRPEKFMVSNSST